MVRAKSLVIKRPEGLFINIKRCCCCCVGEHFKGWKEGFSISLGTMNVTD